MNDSGEAQIVIVAGLLFLLGICGKGWCSFLLRTAYNSIYDHCTIPLSDAHSLGENKPTTTNG